jgi:hypothetical protein
MNCGKNGWGQNILFTLDRALWLHFSQSMIFFHPSELGTLAYFLKLYLEASVGRLKANSSFSFKKYEGWPELGLPSVTSAS